MRETGSEIDMADHTEANSGINQNPKWLEWGLSLIAICLAAYMFYATVFGPYRTTLVH
ncbi:MAG: hypothetical protein HON14_01245, partial [Rhodospirillaceae bacterium]|nr:hypothetical protein [Rhodospirillaceae bacterium]